MLDLAMKSKVVLKAQVQDFISQEMVLLDNQEYAKWLALFDRNARYRVPANPVSAEMLNESMEDIDDNLASLRKRVESLLKHADKTKVQHFLTSVSLKILTHERISVSATSLMFKQRHSRQYLYTANNQYRLLDKGNGEFSIAYKEVRLDNRSVAINGAISTVI